MLASGPRTPPCRGEVDHSLQVGLLDEVRVPVVTLHEVVRALEFEMGPRSRREPCSYHRPHRGIVEAKRRAIRGLPARRSYVDGTRLRSGRRFTTPTPAVTRRAAGRRRSTNQGKGGGAPARDDAAVAAPPGLLPWDEVTEITRDQLRSAAGTPPVSPSESPGDRRRWYDFPDFFTTADFLKTGNKSCLLTLADLALRKLEKQPFYAPTNPSGPFLDA